MTDISFEVKGIKTEVIVVTEPGKQITFNTSPFGPGSYIEVGNEIDKAGLRRPTIKDTVSLVYSAMQNPDNEYSKQVLRIFNDDWFWAFDRVTPSMDFKPKGELYFKNDCQVDYRNDPPQKDTTIHRILGEAGAKRLAEIIEPRGEGSLRFCLNCMVVTEYKRLQAIEEGLIDGKDSKPLRAISLGYGRLPWFYQGGTESQGHAFGLMREQR